MSVVVFVGPSLPTAEARSLCDADYRAPAKRGDVYRAVRGGARAIALIDSVLERGAAVWQKEILWALSQGVHVWGGAASGALCAAELDSFGMVGIGAVYRRYREGFSNDDAVAVAHAGAAHGYRRLSVALVDIERTLQEASLAGVVAAADAYVILCQARDLFFPDRVWSRILADTVAAGLDHRSATKLRAWLDAHASSQTRDDARELLSSLERFIASDPPPFVPELRFEHTLAWEAFMCEADAPCAVGDDAELRELAAELALDGQVEDARAGSAVLALADAEARRQGIELDESTLDNAEQQLRLRLGLEEDERFQVWKQQTALAEHSYRGLLRLLAARAWFLDTMTAASNRFLPSYLRMIGRWSAPSTARESDAAEEHLLHEHFVRTRGTAPPDVDGWVLASGFASREQLVAALRRRARA